MNELIQTIEIWTKAFTALAVAVGAFAGLVAAIVVASEKIARVIPTNWDNKFLRVLFKSLYVFFATVGMKVPDIAKIENGKIVTNVEAIAQKVVDGQTTTAEPKDAVS